ncbi:MAG: response regulator [Balneolaceae bacterium]
MNYNKRVLVVDDNESIHKDIESILSPTTHAQNEELEELERVLFENDQPPEPHQQIVYKIDHAYQGREAVQKVHEADKTGDPYALIFMDVRMPPGMDGVQAIQKIRKNHPHVEIVICTAYADYSWQEILKNLGHSDKLFFMKKPFDPTALKQTALTLTTKWKLQQESLQYTEKLETEVKERTRDLQELLNKYKGMKEEAERAAEAKGTFLANMSHEIRTPMNGILAMNELLLETELTEEQEEYCDLAQQSAQALLRIINDILDFSKIEAGKMDLEEIPFNLKDLVSGVSKMASASARDKDLNVRFDIDDAIPDQVIGDPTRIQQILLNYGNNAVKFTDKGSIEFNIELLDEDKNNLHLKFSVTDTGTGISEEKLATLFTPFSQADSSTTRKYGGTGLGLAICRQLADLMNGEVGADSEEGKGSTFWFDVTLSKKLKNKSSGNTKEKSPVSETVQKQTRSDTDHAHETQHSDPPVKILVAEDTKINRIVLDRLLHKENFELNFVNNGKEAVEAVKNNQFEIVLMDLQMPVMDGIEAAKAIRKMEMQKKNKNRLPIIALTGSAVNQETTACFDAGMDDYLTKPIPKKKLLETLNKWKERAVSSETV